MKIKESLNVTFDENLLHSKRSPLVDDDLDKEEAIKVTKKKNLENDIEDETLEINDVLVPQPKNMTIIENKWVYRNKLEENGVVSHNKARLESIRILLAYACALDFKLFQMDVKSAFLNGFINEEVYVAQPSRFIDFEKPDHVYKLKKALYGLKQAPKACVWVCSRVIANGVNVSGSRVTANGVNGSVPGVTANGVDRFVSQVMANGVIGYVPEVVVNDFVANGVGRSVVRVQANGVMANDVGGSATRVMTNGVSGSIPKIGVNGLSRSVPQVQADGGMANGVSGSVALGMTNGVSGSVSQVVADGASETVPQVDKEHLLGYFNQEVRKDLARLRQYWAIACGLRITVHRRRECIRQLEALRNCQDSIDTIRFWE
ncbi:retrovirus-related pol polyprotein from transposon TNT 1-94 [Tanacetum coccineum]|uniref:Retrovirus-related pol polyprotein from transposon TNT 1-94 n=1 Tax=Tanacetum coccineum TaxID=301880 RepID=A0ABQ5AIE6_9ASTR